jgi:hypothetical protein
MMNHRSSPVLLLDGGATISYTAVDRTGSVMGGGIGMGINLRFKALCEYSVVEEFPEITYDVFREKLMDRLKGKAPPMSLFGTDAETSIIGGVVSELAGSLRNIVKQFLLRVNSNNDSDRDQSLPPAVVVITGGDSYFLDKLLKPDCSSLVIPEPGVQFPRDDEVTFVVSGTSLIPYSVQHLLQSMTDAFPNPESPTDDLRMRIAGLRAARAVSFDQQSGIFRGTIVRVLADKSLEDDTFEIMFDENGGKDALSLIELYGRCFSSTTDCLVLTYCVCVCVCVCVFVCLCMLLSS